MRARRDRGAVIIVVLVITLMVTGVVMVSLMASTTLKQQSSANVERAASRNEARSGINLVAAYLDQRVNSNNGPTPKPIPPSISAPPEWYTDSTGKYYIAIYGRASNGMATCTLDTTGTYGTPGTGAAPSTRSDWLANARSLLANTAARPADVTYLVRVEIEGDWATSNWYYHAYSVAATDDIRARASQTPVVLVSQAALVPHKRSPFIQGGMTGLQQVTLHGTGTFGTTDGSTTKPFISTNKNVVLK